MKYIKILKNLLLCVTAISSSLLADTEIAIMYGAANPDYKPFETTYDYSISGRYEFENGLFLNGYYSETDFLPSGPYVGGTRVSNWQEVGLGFTFNHEWGEFYSLLSIEDIETQVDTIDGYGAHFGYNNQFAQDWKATMQLGRIKTTLDDWQLYDWQLLGKLNYQVSDNLSLTFALRDYDKWDYTNYEAGVIFHF